MSCIGSSGSGQHLLRLITLLEVSLLWGIGSRSLWNMKIVKCLKGNFVKLVFMNMSPSFVKKARCFGDFWILKLKSWMFKLSRSLLCVLVLFSGKFVPHIYQTTLLELSSRKILPPSKRHWNLASSDVLTLKVVS